MKLFSIAIGKQYEEEVKRLQASVDVEVLTQSDSRYKQVSTDNLINALWHKANFANYIEEADGPVIFMDADLFTFIENPLEIFKVKKETEIAYVPYKGKWHLPDKIRQEAFDFHGYKINSGFLYFKDLKTAKKICDQWQYEYLEREKLYDVEKGTSKYEFDEWALMIALMKLNIKVELLDSKWNNWELSTKEEMLESGGIFFQSHNLNIK